MSLLRAAVPADFERLAVGLPPQGLFLPEPGLVTVPVAMLLARRCEDLRARQGWGACLIVEQKLLVGFVVPKPADAEDRAEFGYAISPEQRGRGLAGRAVAAFCDLAAERGLSALIAETDPGNAASIRVLERNQFRPVPQARPDRLRWERQFLR
ncbi:GNAT family N-acetyltransferase [Limimaricola pyoseonensis]|uniref:Protein N-acetyltransferase, RimJ/RimL family n=1 Tax=Limimaricola pyoseonensis TaxID=521013 RepID=A0A1G7GA52_9RHOB|nr:GNAT family N-acetyltransferase [Limimaricola pyoseonensis]SDE84973.1 Protein N-acetyltransferase, RimJ/RimL family [Limimaricola pyoseonensis]